MQQCYGDASDKRVRGLLSVWALKQLSNLCPRCFSFGEDLDSVASCAELRLGASCGSAQFCIIRAGDDGCGG